MLQPLRRVVLFERPHPWICDSCRAVKRSTRESKNRYRGFATAEAPHRREAQKLPDYPARTRFAPSPTGYLHLGSLRTALFNYLFAKATGGQFLLRVEDTDQNRTVPEAERKLCEDLQWAGLYWDEGPLIGGSYGPYRQSERTPLYRQHAQHLLEKDDAYRCFCTQERLRELSEHRSKIGLPSDYDRTCAGIPKEESDERAAGGEKHTLRLLMPESVEPFRDLVYGTVGKGVQKGFSARYGQKVYEDPIIMKTDGFPTYHFANVVDDHFMKITHVIRAVEWMPSTPKHLALYKAFGWEPPLFAHVGLLTGEDHAKLSKRRGSVMVEDFRNEGIFPEALVNYCALLGNSQRSGNDFLPFEDLVKSFEPRFTKGNTILNFKKLKWLQKEYGKRYIAQEAKDFQQMVDETVQAAQYMKKEERSTFDIEDGRDFREYVASLLRADSEQWSSASGFVKRHEWFFRPSEWLENLPANLDDYASVLSYLHDKLKSQPAEKWQAEELKLQLETTRQFHQRYLDAMSQGTIRLPQRAHNYDASINKTVRWAILGGRPGPPLHVALELLGKDVAVHRITTAMLAARNSCEEGLGDKGRRIPASETQ